jgi:tetratricopeptide (TPR) repeat protein
VVCLFGEAGIGKSRLACEARDTLAGGRLAEVGEFGEGLTLGEEGIQVAEAVDQPFSRIAAYYSAGSLYLQQGDFHKAISVLERNLALCQAADNRLFFPLVASGLGCALAYTGLSP